MRFGFVLAPVLALALAACAADSSARVEEVGLPAPAPATEPHRWLQQLVGTWDVEARAVMEPGGEETTMRSRETVRAIGELWILAETTADMGGTPFTSLLTLGYDPAEQAFVGTWVDSVQTRLWTYRGALDAGGTKLTLDTEGPSWGDATKTSRYRDAIELVSPDHKVLTSSVQAADGTWSEFMRVDYRRRR